MMKPKKNPVTKVAGKIAKEVAKKVTKKTAPKSSRQTGDIVISGKSAKNVVPKMGTKSTDISENVSIKNAKSSSGKIYLTGGAGQVFKQNTRSILGGTKAEAKASARGLKAANKPTNKVGSKADKELRSRTKSVNTSKEEMKAIYDYKYGKGTGKDITQINKQITPKNEARSVRKMPKKKSK